MKVLLAFGTKYGSTAKVADRIAEVMRSEGHEVQVLDLRNRERPDLSGFDLIVLGSSIVVGAWSKGAQRFISENKGHLGKMNVAMFACCGNLLTEPEKKNEYRKLYLEDVANEAGIKPVSMSLFGGEIDLSKYGFLTKALLSGVGAKKAWIENGVDTSRPYDFRDWGAIASWASQLSSSTKGNGTS